MALGSRPPEPLPAERLDLRFSRVEIGVAALFWLLALGLGFVQAWKTRYAIDHDAVSYLDMGDAYFRGDWKMALNGYFNPFYAWVLGLTLTVFRPGPEWEFPLVHLVAYVIFAVCLLCFAFFLKELLAFRERFFATRGAAGERPSLVFWIVLGYAVFIWSSLDLAAVSSTNPDMLLAAAAYLAAALIIRIQRGRGTLPVYLGLGAVLGIGYLTKSVFLPLGLVFLGIGLWASLEQKGARAGFLLAGVVFALLAGPLIAALSLGKGRLTISDAGRLNYAWYVNEVPIRHWQGGPPEFGRPIHPTRLLAMDPATYEFATPVGGTYPVWYDVSYWYEGLKVPFSLRLQAAALKKNLVKIAGYFLRLRGAFVISAIVLLFAVGRPLGFARRLTSLAAILVPSVTALISYALVTVEPRYLGAFITITLLALFVALHADGNRVSRTIFPVLAAALLVLVLDRAALVLRLTTSRETTEAPSSADAGRNEPAAMVQGLRRLGLTPGTWIAGLDYSKGQNLAWARLARIRIVSEVFYSPTTIALRKNNFWKASWTTQDQILDAFARVGAQAVVSDEAPPPTASPSATWSQVGETHFYVHVFGGAATVNRARDPARQRSLRSSPAPQRSADLSRRAAGVISVVDSSPKILPHQRDI